MAVAGSLGFLGDILVRHGALSQARLEAALAEQAGRGGRLGTVLVDAGFCTEEQIGRALAAQFLLTFITVDAREIDAHAVTSLGIDFLRKHAILPLVAKGGSLRLAVADPLEVEALDRVQSVLRIPVETVVALRTQILSAVDAASRLDQGTSITSGRGAGAAGATGDAGTANDAAPVLDEVLAKGVRWRATDIHFEPEQKAFRVRYRIDGVLQQGDSFPKEFGGSLIARIKILAELDICEHRLPQDGRARISTPAGLIDLRISILPTIHGEGCVVRVLDRQRSIVAPSELNMAPRVHEPLAEMIQRPHGLLLVTGPTGSGKTTTLYSLLSTVDAMERKVITVEDPVEYEFPMVRQCQVKPAIGFTFASALRAILRHDPEVVLIGEIRDRETAEIATRAALTGHLVLSTLHTNSAIGAVPRLLDMGIDPFLMNASLIGVIGQRLARRLCKSCRVPAPMSAKERAALPESLRTATDETHAPKGCAACADSGFRGRVGLHELVIPNDEFRAAVTARAGEQELHRIAVTQGFVSMVHDGAEKTLTGLTTMAETLRVANDSM